MSGKKTLVWAGVLLALAAFYYLYELQGATKRYEAAWQRQRLLPFAVEQVTAVTVTRPDESLTTVNRQGHWQLTVPLSAAGDDVKTNALVQRLSALRYQRLVEAHPTSLEPFGLSTPTLTIQVHLDQQSAPLGVRLGTQNPTATGCYAQVEGRAAVYLIDTGVKDSLEVSLYDLRDKTILAFTPADVRAIRLGSQAMTPIVLQRRDDHGWQMTSPVHARADDDQVGALLQHLQEARVQRFIAEIPTDLEPYGLHLPMLQIALTLGHHQTVQTLQLGKLDANANGIYARRDTSLPVLLLSQQFWDDLPRTVTALRDKTLLQFNRQQISQLELQSAQERLVLTRSPGDPYRLEEPFRDDGDRGAINRLLTALEDLKANAFVAEAPTAFAPYGLEAPRQRITLAEQPADRAPERRQQTLLIGDEAPTGTYVRVATRPTVYLVDSAAARRLLKITAFDLRDKRLLRFQPERIEKIHVQYPATAFTLERHGNTWRLIEPRKQPIPQRWKVDRLLDELRDLEYAKIVTLPEHNADDVLKMPQVRLMLWHEDGVLIGPLTIGRAAPATDTEPRMVYARRNSEPLLYAILATFLDNLPKQASALTDEAP